jgi:outer membrane lipoprotein-sorting protein
MRFFFLLLVLACGPLSSPGLAQESTVSEARLRELLDGADDLHRGASSHAEITMNVRTARYARSMRMETWAQGETHSLIRILAPAREAGMTTLKIEDNIWHYLPNIDRTMKVPGGMMAGSWMGSHFSNDDLVKGSRMADDYSFTLTEEPAADGRGQYVIECLAKDDAPVVWGKVMVTLRPDGVPTEISYWEEDGTLVRTMFFSDVREIGGESIPFHMRLVPANEPEEFTEIVYEAIEFDIEIPDSMFSLQALRR